MTSLFVFSQHLQSFVLSQGHSLADLRNWVGLSIQKSNDPVGDLSFIQKEIGDVALSLYNLAHDQDVPLPSAGPETPKSVFDWCALHYPGESLTKKTLNLVEEGVELALVVKGSMPALQQVLKNVSLLDLWHDLERIAQYHHLSVSACLQQVMEMNRRKTVEESQARSARKTAQGLRA